MLAVEERERFTLEMQNKIVLIYSGAASDYSSGHGVVISSNGYLLTASHLFNANTYSVGSEVEVSVGCNGVTLPRFYAKIIAIERKADLALLKIVKRMDNRSKLKFKYARLGEEVRIGQEVHMIISTDGQNFSYTPGLVCFEKRLRGDILGQDEISFIRKKTHFVQGHGLHGMPGCSGAPIFDSSGRVLGIYSSGYKRMDLMIHLSLLITLLIKMCQKLEKRKRAMMMVIGPYKKFKGLKQEKRERKERHQDFEVY